MSLWSGRSLGSSVICEVHTMRFWLTSLRMRINQSSMSVYHSALRQAVHPTEALSIEDLNLR